MAPRRRSQRRVGGSRGFTLLELIIVIGVLVLMIGIGVQSFSASSGFQLRTQTNKLAAAVRHTFNRSVSYGLYMRLVIDIESDAYWVEASDRPVFLSKEKLEAGEVERREKDAQEAEREAQEKAADRGERAPESRRARFQEDGVIERVTMEKGIGVDGVFAAGQDDEFKSGKAYIHFFPNGFAQPAIIYTTDGDDVFYTLEIHPLTGRVSSELGRHDPPRYFGEPEDVEDERY